jgi:hypothetical protein
MRGDGVPQAEIEVCYSSSMTESGSPDDRLPRCIGGDAQTASHPLHARIAAAQPATTCAIFS